MRTAALYARVSTSEQVKGTSLDGQVALCEQYARENGYTVVKVVQEDASGSRLDRPKLGEIRNMAERREIEAVIVFDPDRLSRSMAHTMMLMEEFERNKADVLFVNAPREDTPEGEMLFGMRALFAQYERTKIAERTRRGKERRVREGQVMTTRNCPFGYEYVKSEKRLQVLDSEAAWVTKIFEWAVYEGCSLREIARRLNVRAVPTKAGARAWGPSTVRAILDNEAYAGTWHYGRYTATEPKRHSGNTRRPKSSKERKPRSEWLSVPVPSIIPQGLFDAVAGQLERNRAMSPRNGKNQYLLKGLLFCARCGHRMYGEPGSHEGSTGRYSCPAQRQKHVYATLETRCSQPSISLARIENTVWGEVVRQLSDEKVLRERLEEREAELKRGRKDDEAELEIIINLELGLKKEAGTLLDLHMSDVIDRETLQERMSVVREKQTGITRSKAEVTARLAQWERGQASDGAIAKIGEFVAAHKGIATATFEEKRMLLEGMDAKLKLDGNKVTITGLITESTLTIADKRANGGIVNITPTGDIRNTSFFGLGVPFYAILTV